MTKEGDITLREMVRQSINQSNEILTQITEIKTHNLYTQKSIAEHEQKIEKINGVHKTQKGVLWGLGITGGTAFFHSLKNILGI